MSKVSNVSKKPHFRNLRVEPYDPLPGLGDGDHMVDVSRFNPYRYVVTFEYRTGWRRKWCKVRGLA